MEWLNYHHLLYFWVAAKEGSIARAGRTLKLSHPTISAQIRRLERRLGERLFARQGRGLVLTEVGRLVANYAEEIFGLGDEMMDALRGRPTGRTQRVTIGVADAIPKLLAYELIQAAVKAIGKIHLVCRESSPAALFERLSSHTLDVVLSDAPLVGDGPVKTYNHVLAEYDVTIFGSPAAAATLAKKFPASLDGAPLLLPTRESSLRRSLDQWFDAHAIRPEIAGEFDDSALMKVFGQTGLGLFPAPTIIEAEVCRQYNVRPIGRIPEIHEKIYAVSVERRLKHPAVLALAECARQLIAQPHTAAPLPTPKKSKTKGSKRSS